MLPHRRKKDLISMKKPSVNDSTGQPIHVLRGKKSSLDKIKAGIRKWRNAPPPEIWLKTMVTSEWPDYESWLFRYAFLNQEDWRHQRKTSRKLPKRPLFSLLTPVFNVAPTFLKECVESVLFQSYPFWELLLVDDASTRAETRSFLQQLSTLDDRISVRHNPKNLGICTTTNAALDRARGEFSVFLDHDDKLAPNALFEVAKVMNTHPETDIIYSDRDLISIRGSRFMHLFKPEWAPETILSSNYLCHLTSYRTTLLKELNGLDQETEGSQDHDLILRAEEKQPHVYHIPKVLYHWRQHPESVAFNPESKEYAYKAASLSVSKALMRRNLTGTVEEIDHLWRGNYRVILARPPKTDFHVHQVTDFRQARWPEIFSQALDASDSKPYLIFLDTCLHPMNSDALEELVSWFQITAVCMTSGKILNDRKEIIHAGLLHNPEGKIISIYQGMAEQTALGYMAWAASSHNVSLVHPGCFAVRRKTLRKTLAIFKQSGRFLDPFSLSLQVRASQKRIVYTPFARFSGKSSAIMQLLQNQENRERFFSEWQDMLKQGDPYFSKNLEIRKNDISLNFSRPSFRTSG